MKDDLPTEGTAAARPEDRVREFMQQLEHPETRLRTDTRRDGSDVYGGTNWGDAGKAAILDALRKATGWKRLERIEAPTIDQLEKILQEPGGDVEIRPDGSVWERK